jgi:hypothetical protein
MVVGGTDAGEKILFYYAIAEDHYPILADSASIATDTPAGSFGLAWCYGLNSLGEPVFAVRDDIDVDVVLYVGFHESGHAFQSTCAKFMAIKEGITFQQALDRIRQRYWTWRGFPGTWWDGQLKAINGGGWPYYPDESFADAFAHAMFWAHPFPGYVTGEWTDNYGVTPEIWRRGAEAYQFFTELMQEAAPVAYVTQEELAAYQADVRNTLEAMKAELAKQAHHKHDTSEPKAA